MADCEAMEGKTWYCATHYAALYEDGMCVDGRAEMNAKQNGPAYYPTPQSGFAPPSVGTESRRPASGVRFVVPADEVRGSASKLRAMREQYPAIFRTFALEGVLATLEKVEE